LLKIEGTKIYYFGNFPPYFKLILASPIGYQSECRIFSLRSLRSLRETIRKLVDEWKMKLLQSKVLATKNGI